MPLLVRIYEGQDGLRDWCICETSAQVITWLKKNPVALKLDADCETHLASEGEFKTLSGILGTGRLIHGDNGTWRVSTNIIELPLSKSDL